MNAPRMRIAVAAIGLLTSACLASPITEGSGGSSSGEPATSAPDPGESTAVPTPPVATSTTSGADTTAASSTGPGGLGEGEECDLMIQDCAPGLKCMPFTDSDTNWWTGTACFPVDDDPVGMGEECEWYGGDFSGHDNCGFGQFCNTFTNDPGICQDLCRLEDPDDYDTLYCPAPMTAPVWCQECFCWCIPTCDPLAAEPCIEGQSCVPTTDFFECVPDASGDMGAAGDPCEFINTCDPGLACLDAAATPGCESGLGCCTPLCDITQPNTCPFAAEGQECLPWWQEGEAPPGLEIVGVCAVPA